MITTRRQALGIMASAPAIVRAAGVGPFLPSWESLGEYSCPDWFRDAKFGIFMHWGIPSVTDENRPFGTGHYANGMYYQHGRMPDGKPLASHLLEIYDFHVKRYGHPSKFGYKDFIPLWKAERWNPDELVGLYKRCGARYIVPVAVHHDNFDIFESSHQWNVARMGPRRDILGGWRRAAQKHEVRFGCSSHVDRALNFLAGSHGSDYEGPLKGVPYDGANPKFADLYLAGMTPERWQQVWYQRTQELIDKYQPDLLYFDGGLPNGDLGLKIAARHYNASVQRCGGRCDAVLNIKRGPNHKSYVWDIERGQSDRVQPYPWQTETTLISGWFYHKADLEMTADVAIGNLLDIVSKNGNLLLNVGLRPDGTLPENQLSVLEAMGAWLRVYGEAIYGTRPWKTFGEGPTYIKPGSFQEQRTPFTAEDVRFTTKAGKLYAGFLAVPKSKVTIHSLSVPNAGRIARVSALGTGAPLQWKQTDQGLEIQPQERWPSPFAPVLRIDS
jgi:alpha-L-fucosidase